MTHLTRAGLYVIASTLAFASMGALIKHSSMMIPNEVLVFFRNLVALLILTPWALATGVSNLKTSCLSLHLLRAGAGLTAMYCYFFALAHIGLAEAVTLHMTTPLFIPIIAWLWLRESIPSTNNWAIGLGYVGVLISLKPGHGVLTSIAWFALASGLFAAVAMVCFRRLAATEHPFRIVWYFSLIGTIVSAVPLLWAWQPLTPSIVATLVVIGSLATAGQLFLTRGYSLAAAGHAGAFAYSEVVFGFTLGWILWSEIPDALSLIGMILVCLAGILVLSEARETQAPRHPLIDP